MDINAKFLRPSILKTAASENLSGSAILLFRRYFRSSSLPAFKVSVLKTPVKFLEKHICWSVFSINLQPEVFLNERLHHRYFSIKKFYLKNTFLTEHLWATASDT